MRHRKTGRRLDMDSSQRKAMFRNMATSLMLHGQIRTTEARAKELRRFAERLISIGKRAPSTALLAAAQGDALSKAKADRVAALRQLASFLQHDDAINLVLGEYADRFRSRPGGYTRVVKLGRPRPGDNAPMAILQLVEAYDPSARASAGTTESRSIETSAPSAEPVAPSEPSVPPSGEPEGSPAP
jgi:large subunit ribosomal protein L17